MSRFRGGKVWLETAPALVRNNLVSGGLDGLKLNGGYYTITGNAISGSRQKFLTYGTVTPTVVGTGQFDWAGDKGIAVGGTLTQDTVWSPENNLGQPYVVTDHVNVNAGATLRIEPGTVVKFEQARYLRSYGILDAQGTTAEPIYFTSLRDDSDETGGDTNGDAAATIARKGDWYYLNIDGASSVGSVLRHVEVRYGGYGSYPMVNVYRSTPVISESLFRDAQDEAISYYASGGTITGNTISGPTQGIYFTQDGIGTPLLIEGNQVSTTGQYGIRVSRGDDSTLVIRNNEVVVAAGTGIHVQAGAGASVDVDSNTVAGADLGLSLQGAGLETAPALVRNNLVSGGLDGLKLNGGYYTITGNAISGSRQKFLTYGTVTPTVVGTGQFDWAGDKGIAVGGTITQDTVWSPENNLGQPYVVTDHVNVNAGATLRIEPGTVVKFEQARYLRSYGILDAQGTTARPIYFTSLRDDSDETGGDTNGDAAATIARKGDWYYLNIDGASSVGSVLRHVEVRYGGYGSYPMVNVYRSTPVISESLFRDAQDEAISYYASGGTITGNTISGPTQGIYFTQDGTGTPLLIEGNQVSTTGQYGIRVSRGDDSTLVIRNNEVVAAAGTGIHVQASAGASVDVDSNTVAGADLGLSLQGAGLETAPALVRNNLVSGGLDGLKLNGGYYTITGNAISGSRQKFLTYGTVTPTVVGTGQFDWAGDKGIAVGGTLTQDTVWSPENNLGQPYVVTDHVNVNAGATLRIEPGTVVKFEQARYLRSYGILDAQGTTAEPIYFTSLRDDSDETGGDTNGDAAATIARKGDWYYLNIDGASSVGSVLRHVEVRYGGYGSYPMVNVYRSTPVISESLFRDAQDEAISYYASGGTITGNTISGPTQGIYFTQDGIGTPLLIEGNQVSTTGQYGIRVSRGDDSTLVIRNNEVVVAAGTGIHVQAGAGASVDVDSNTVAGADLGLSLQGAGLETAPALVRNNLVSGGLDGLKLNGGYYTITGNAISGSRQKFLTYGTVTPTVVGTGQFDWAGDKGIAVGGTITQDTVWSPENNLGQPYVVTDHVNVNAGATLRIEPGTVVKFEQARYLRSYGILDAQGTTARPIYFTSLRDDSDETGGDTNGDAAATIARKGDWYYLNIDGASSVGSVLRHVEVRYGGYGSYPMVNVYRSTPVISESLFRDAQDEAIYYSSQTEIPEVHFCKFEDIGGNALHNATASVVVDARYNYWGASDGPSGVGAGSGEPVSSYVDFAPWLTGSNDYGGDSDHDGVPDSFELVNGFDPFDAADALADADGDGFTNYQEFVAGTDPNDDSSTPSLPSVAFIGTEGETLFLSASAVSAYGAVVSYEWDFGDGGTGSGSSTSHTYAEAGNYLVSLKVTDELGISNTKQAFARVEDSEPDVIFTMSEARGFAPLSIQFQDHSGAYDGVASRSWDFGDGSEISTAQNPEHSFTGSGTYTVTLTIIDGDGSESSTSQTVEVVQGLLDTDGDGMPDSWEIAKGTNRDVPDAEQDPDEDNITSQEEYAAGTGPLDKDSRPEGVDGANYVLFRDHFDDARFDDRWYLDVESPSTVYSIHESGTSLQEVLEKPVEICESIRLNSFAAIDAENAVMRVKFNAAEAGMTAFGLIKDLDEGNRLEVSFSEVEPYLVLTSWEGGIETYQNALVTMDFRSGEIELRLVKTGSDYALLVNGVLQQVEVTNSSLSNTRLRPYLFADTCPDDNGDVNVSIDLVEILADQDADGLADTHEDTNADGVVDTGESDPLNPDSDSDMVSDGYDNCLLANNGDQRDSNEDGYGNICDPDFNNNGIVDPADFSKLKAEFGSTTAPDQDLNGNGIVDPFDFSKLKSSFGKPPGPSGLVP